MPIMLHRVRLSPPPTMASKRVDWGRFGLASDAEREASETTRLKDPALEEGYYGGQDAELFAEEKVSVGLCWVGLCCVGWVWLGWVFTGLCCVVLC
ncbi:hypothetical protein E2C01_041205 [Portunus trituberculatus]|uniref:Uncharacterized protein n=1 Tax=Portunus trituberculatus TaxID=210409 RepID=A0A5B7FQ24_PORTR|nr:hypothetical protein [Portunus trituberculatus]